MSQLETLFDLQNIFALADLFDEYQSSEVVKQWIRENKENINYQNYNSHSWHWVKDPGSPYQSPEHIRVCKVCGLEDTGSPEEFDIEYPNCAEMGD